ncbi:TPA: TIGR02584 family CRISPR-associated protein [Raoultella ornithinolytica]|nr:TIGR02584 family CRISPR-associated protein [Raoultella ornithinolytica]
MKHILLATIGASPQVLTETLYALHQSGKPFPDEVFVITTGVARQKLVNGLFRDGHLQALKNEYQLPEFCFDEQHIWLIEDKYGQQLEDTQSPEEQEAAADFIIRQVFRLTQNANCAIHASLAGGRKTMTFYFGYAMSLLGRAQDTLSHVFVDEPYEFVRDFWYPTKDTRWVAGQFGQREVDTKNAQVRLVEIPFVRMRESVSPTLIDSMSSHSFSQIVALINETHRGELSVRLDKSRRTIGVQENNITLTPKEFAFYLWLHSKGKQGIVVDRDFSEQEQHSRDFLRIYAVLAKDPRVFNTFDTSYEVFSAGGNVRLRGMEKEFIQTVRSTINQKLTSQLPAQTARNIEISAYSEKTQHRYALALFNHPVAVTLLP